MPRKKSNRKKLKRKNIGKGSGASKPSKPRFTKKELEIQNKYGEIMLNYHRGVLFNHNKLPHQSYNKMYGFIVSEGNKKKIEQAAWEDAINQVNGDNDTDSDSDSDVGLDQVNFENPQNDGSKRKKRKRRRRKRKKKYTGKTRKKSRRTRGKGKKSRRRRRK